MRIRERFPIAFFPWNIVERHAYIAPEHPARCVIHAGNAPSSPSFAIHRGRRPILFAAHVADSGAAAAELSAQCPATVARERVTLPLDAGKPHGGCQIIERNWRYVYVNAAGARHGRTSVEALVGRTIGECYPGIEQTEMFALLQRCLETRTPASMENEFVAADGTHQWFQLVIQPFQKGW
ncbi:MAG TPA: PAS domain-containing protein [Thermoanaerobaculia bacterium]|nr:PAS domain-containing protein [Thermoanaerobaculia bacterium]